MILCESIRRSSFGVFQEDPIYAPRPAGGVRIAVVRSPERVERVRAFLVTGGEVAVDEARFGERLVDPVAWPAVEVSRNDGRRICVRAAGELRDLPHDELAAFLACRGAYVVEVRVQVEESEIRPQQRRTAPTWPSAPPSSPSSSSASRVSPRARNLPSRAAPAVRGRRGWC